MPLGYTAYITDASGNKAVVTSSGSLNVSLQSGATIGSVTLQSGNTMVVTSSGIDTLTVSSGLNVVVASGLNVRVGSGLNVIVGSGVYIIAPAMNQGRSRAVLTLDNNSGGTILQSGDCESMILKSMAVSSGDVYVGYSNERPYSGFGYALQAGESIALDVNNFNKVAVFGIISGFCSVTYTGIAF